MGLGKLYKDALEKAIDGQAKVYDYANDFDIIWGKDSDLPSLSCQSSDTPIVIVWDGPPKADSKPGTSDAILEEHLTPLDWALAFSIKVLEAKPPNISIHIIDLTAHRYEEIWAIRMRHQLLADMPWLRLYTPMKPEPNVPFLTHNSAMVLDGDDANLAALLINTDGSWKINQKFCERTIENSAKSGQGKRLKSLATQWAASLTQSNDHHDVNNVIGPNILLEPEIEPRILPSAFLTKLAWSDSDHAPEKARVWKPWGAFAASNSLFSKSLTVFAVDDQLPQGWGRFVCRLFGNQKICTDNFETDDFVQLNCNQMIKIFGCLGSNPLIKFLQNEAVFDCRDFHTQISQEQHPSPELILLDLRLYAGVKEAQKQAQALLEIIKNRVNNCGNKLAWIGFDNDELTDIQKWCKGEDAPIDEKTTQEDALLILPRLLALALPLTPIIFFSSTNQVRIREKLKHYQNIFTGFEKPRVLSSPKSIGLSISALHDGLDNALKIMRLRLQLAHIQKAISKAEQYKNQNIPLGLSTHHIELYADETGLVEQGITSAVAVCIYPTVDMADDLQNRFLLEFDKTKGSVWAKNACFPDSSPGLTKGSTLKKEPIETIYDQVESLCKILDDVSLKKDVRQLWSVVATRIEGVIPETSKVSLAAFSDGPLDDALRYNLEFILFVLIPYLTNNDASFTGDVQLYLPSRKIPLTPSSNLESDGLHLFAKNLCDSFDLGLPSPFKKKVSKEQLRELQIYYPNFNTSYSRTFITTFTFNKEFRTGSAFPLVRGWLHEWRYATPNITEQITKVKMTILGRGNNGIYAEEAAQRRLFHDIADWTCSASGDSKGKVFRDVLEKKGVFRHWLKSTDSDKIDVNQEWYVQDTRNAFALMSAVKTSRTANDIQNRSRVDVIRKALRNSYISNCDKRLLENDQCAQQRLILWALRKEFSSARGCDLHALLADETGQPKIDAGIENKQVADTKSNLSEIKITETKDSDEDATARSIIAEPEDIHHEEFPGNLREDRECDLHISLADETGQPRADADLAEIQVADTESNAGETQVAEDAYNEEDATPRLIIEESKKLYSEELPDNLIEARGCDIHISLADEAGQPETTDTGISEKYIPETKAAEAPDGEVEASPMGIIDEQGVRPRVLSGQQIEELFPHGQHFFPKKNQRGEIPKVMICTTNPNLVEPSHSIKDKDIIEQLYIQEWRNPLTVWGEELETKIHGTYKIKVFAAQLADGNWDRFV